MADAGIRLTVEGEKEFKAALAEIDAAVKNNQKAMRSLTEEFRLNETGMKAAAEGIGSAAGEATKGFGSMADAVEILKTKGKVLADSIEMQEEKFGLLNERVEEARQTYGEYDKRTMELKNQLLDASTALTKLRNEQEKNNQAVLDAQHSTKEYDDAVKTLEAQLAANQAELKAMGGGLDALKKEYGDLDKESGTLEKSTGLLGKMFGSTGKDAETLRKQEENLGKQNETLRQQNEKLTDSVTKQRDLIDKLASAQKVAAERYGEGSKEAETYRKKLADATGQLDAMERELKENNKAIEDNNQAIENGGDAPNGMLDGLKKIEEMTGIKIPAGIETMISGFGGGALAVGGIVTVLGQVAQKMEAIWKESVGWAKDVTTESAELDLSTEQYQELEYIATATGTSVSALTGALGKIEQKASDAAYTQETLRYKMAELREEMEKAQKSREYWSEQWQATGDDRFATQLDLAKQEYEEARIALEELQKQADEATSYFDDLGVSIYDANGDVKDSLTLLNELLDAYAGIESEAIRNKEMNELLGKSYRTLKPYLTEGSEGFKQLAEEAHRFGLVLEDEEVEALKKAEISLNTYHAKQDAVKREYAALREQQDNAFKDLLSYLSEGVDIADEFLRKLRQGSKYTPSQGSTGLTFEKWTGWSLIKSLFGFASGTNYAPGGMALVGEQGPEIVELPRGSKVYPNGTAPELAGGSVVNESNVYNITIDAASVEEFNDIVRIAQGARVGMRRG